MLIDHTPFFFGRNLDCWRELVALWQPIGLVYFAMESVGFIRGYVFGKLGDVQAVVIIGPAQLRDIKKQKNPQKILWIFLLVNCVEYSQHLQKKRKYAILLSL